MLLGLGACIPLPNDLGGDQSTATEGTMGASDSVSGTSAADGAEAPGDSTSEGFDEDIKLDMNTNPLFEPCREVGPSTVTVTSSQTSKGDLPVAHAVYGWSRCCYRKPRLVLTVDPLAPEGFPLSDPPSYVEVIALDNRIPSDWEGVHIGTFQDDGQDSPTGPQGSIEFFEVLSAELIDDDEPDPAQRLQARVVLTTDGWDFDVEVDAPYCVAYDLPDCACE